MALWGKTDTLASAPKYLIDGANTSIVPTANTARDYGGLPDQVDVNNAFFVDTTEAAVESNRDSGLRTPGWNLFTTYTDANGATRRRVESLVVMKVAAADAGDLGVSGNTDIEDTTVADS
jgi:hypothetical protein